MDGVRRATPTRVPCIRSSGAAARVARSRGRGRAYTVRTLKPLPVTSRDYDGRLYRTQEVALSGHTAVALPSIPGLAVYLGLTWAGCSPLVRCVPPPGRRGYLWVWRMQIPPPGCHVDRVPSRHFEFEWALSPATVVEPSLTSPPSDSLLKLHPSFPATSSCFSCSSSSSFSHHPQACASGREARPQIGASILPEFCRQSPHHRRQDPKEW